MSGVAWAPGWLLLPYTYAALDPLRLAHSPCASSGIRPLGYPTSRLCRHSARSRLSGCGHEIGVATLPQQGDCGGQSRDIQAGRVRCPTCRSRPGSDHFPVDVLTTMPLCMTKPTSMTAWMSSRGLRDIATTSAAMPGASLPTSLIPPAAAALTVPAIKASIGVIPESTTYVTISMAFCPCGTSGASVPTAILTPSLWASVTSLRG